MTSGRNISRTDRAGSATPRVPAYKALYEQLRTSILSGQLAAGTRLPPSRMLAAETGLSRNTVLAAFEQLQAEGYIEGRQGSALTWRKPCPSNCSEPPAAPGGIPRHRSAQLPSSRRAANGLPGPGGYRFRPFWGEDLSERPFSSASLRSIPFRPKRGASSICHDSTGRHLS